MNTSLPIRPFGSTADRTTALGLGGAVLANSSYRDGVATVRRALELGVKYFDTSPGYCANESQLMMGEGLADAPDDIMVATKVGYFETPAGFRSEDEIKHQIEDNLKRLRRDSVDVLQVHEANWASWWDDHAESRTAQISAGTAYEFADAPAIRVLRWAREQGLCRYIGITGNVSHQMTRILADVDVDTFLVAYSYDLIVRSAEADAIPLARSKDVVLILGAIFYGGRLVAPHPEWLTSPPEWMDADLRDRFDRLYRIQDESGIPLVEMAMRFALAQGDASVVLVGCARPREIEQLVEATLAGELPADAAREIANLGRRAEESI